MNISDLTLRDLEYIIAVGKHRHFGKAANEVHVSQPGLSTQIKKIEEILGVTLFERSNRKVQVTQVGEQIIRQSQNVLEEAKKIPDLAKKIEKPMEGPFHIGAISSLGPGLFPYLLPPLRKKYPKLELILKEGLTEELLIELKEGRLDCILASPTFPPNGFEIYELFFEPFILCTPKSHPFSTLKSIQASALKAKDMVILEDGHCLKDQMIEVCSPQNRFTDRESQATSLETLRYLVACGAGYTLIPQLAVQEDKRLKELVSYVPFEDKKIGRKIILVSRAKAAMKRDIEELVDFIKKLKI